MTRSAPYIALCVVLFGLYNSCAGNAEALDVGRRVADGTLRLDAGGVLRLLRAYGTDDADVQRYRAYSDAALGRPHNSYYVRTAAQWQAPPPPDGAPAEAWPTAVPSRPLVPYRDYLVEYPPGFFLLTLPPALLTRDLDTYRLLFSIEMGLLLLVALHVTARASSLLPPAAPDLERRLPAWMLASVLALGVIVCRRGDAALSLLLALVCHRVVAGKPFQAGLALGVAVLLKGIPLLWAPLVLLYLARRGRLRDVLPFGAAAALTGALIGVPALWYCGGSVVDALRYHGERPLQIESAWAGGLGLLRAAGAVSVEVTQGFGSTNVIGPAAERLARLAPWVVVAGLALCLLATARRLRRAAEPAEQALCFVDGALALLLVYIAGGKVISPQYLVWLVPLAFAVLLRRPPAARWLLLAALVLTQIIYPIAYYAGAIAQLAPWAAAAVLARALLVAAVCVLVLRAPRMAAAAGAGR